MLLRLDALSLVEDDSVQLEKALRVAEGVYLETSRRVEALALRLEEAPESPTISGAIARAEGELRSAADAVHKLKQELAAEKGIGWEEFLRRLDLVSYEGRMKANALMKRQGVLVMFGASGYGITRDGRPIFAMDYRKGEGAGYWMPGFGGALPTFLPVSEVPGYVDAEDASQAAYDAAEDEGQSCP